MTCLRLLCAIMLCTTSSLWAQGVFFNLDLDDRHSVPVSVHAGRNLVHVVVSGKDALSIYSFDSLFKTHTQQNYTLSSELKDVEVLGSASSGLGHTIYTLTASGIISAYRTGAGTLAQLPANIDVRQGVWLHPQIIPTGLRTVRADEGGFMVYNLSPEGGLDSFAVSFDGFNPYSVFEGLREKNELFVLKSADTDYPQSGVALYRKKLFSLPTGSVVMLDADDHTLVIVLGMSAQESYLRRLSWQSEYVKSNKLSGNSYLCGRLLVRASVDTDEMLSLQLFDVLTFELLSSYFMYPKDPWLVNGLLLEQVQERGRKSNFQPVKDYSKFLKRLKGNLLITAEMSEGGNLLVRVGSLYREYIPTGNVVSPGIGFSTGGYPGGMMMTPTYREVITEAYFKTLLSSTGFAHLPGVSYQTTEEMLNGLFKSEFKDAPDKSFILPSNDEKKYLFYFKRHRKIYGVKL